MRDVLKGGLRSLIPNRDVTDPDDVLDEIDDEMESEEEPSEEAEESRRVNIVSGDDDEDESDVEDADVDEVEPVEEELELDVPKKPLVTPLTIDLTKEEEEALLGTKKVVTSKKPAGNHVKAVRASDVARKARTADTAPARQKTDSVEQAAQAPVASEDVWDKHEQDVQHIAIGDIRINPNQPRRKFEETEMEELKQSIAQHGILQPLVVRRLKQGYELIAGERRLRAARDLEWDRVPCVVRRNVSSGASQLELALIENIQREDLNPIEEAMAYRQLNEEYGMTHEEIGERVGRSRVGITNIIRVLQLPSEIQKGLADGTITSGHAKAILMIPDDEKQLRFYRHLVDEGLTVRKAETRARRIQRTMNLEDPMRHKRKGRTKFELKFSGALEDHYGYNARVRFNELRNRYEIHFRCHSKEEIDQLIGRLLGTEELPAEAQDQDVIESDEDE